MVTASLPLDLAPAWEGVEPLLYDGLDPEQEFYTPARIMDYAHKLFPFGIDLDPASVPAANAVVRAWRFFDVTDDGLAQDWHAHTLWLNPPYGRGIPAWTRKFLTEYGAGNIHEGLLLLPAKMDTVWFHELWEAASVVCFLRGRIAFDEGDEHGNRTPARGSGKFSSALVYFGNAPKHACRILGELGQCVIPVEDAYKFTAIYQ